MTKHIHLRFSDDMPASSHWRHIEQLARADRMTLRYRFGEPCDPRRLIELYDVRRILETYDDYQKHFQRPMVGAFDQLPWSGMLLHIQDGEHLILVNPDHLVLRRNLTIGHEFGHLACNHQPISVAMNGGMPQSRYSDDQELDAFGYGLAMLLPYAPLLQMLRQGATAVGIAHHYQVSVQAVEMRLRLTGLWGVLSNETVQP
jgi:Zn-dependent peptidase ImmA (M78 family)